MIHIRVQGSWDWFELENHEFKHKHPNNFYHDAGTKYGAGGSRGGGKASGKF